MGVNKFVYGGTTKFDLTGDDVTQADVLSGKKFHNAAGNQQTGTMVDQGTKTVTLDTSTTSYTIPAGKHSGSGYVQIDPQSKTTTPSLSQQIITPGSGKVLSQVTVNAISLGSGAPNFSTYFWYTRMYTGWSYARTYKSTIEKCVGFIVSIYKREDKSSDYVLPSDDEAIVAYIKKTAIFNYTESNPLTFSGTLRGTSYTFSIYGVDYDDESIRIYVKSDTESEVTGIKGYIYWIEGIT